MEGEKNVEVYPWNIGVLKQLEAVSYTQLPLPTNREV